MRGIRRPVEFEAMVRRLAEDPHPSANRSIFPTMRDLVCFAAALGFQVRRKAEIQGPTNEIDGRIVERSDTALDLIYLIALCETRNVEVLLPQNEEESFRIFEEYVAGGLAELTDWMSARPEDLYGDQAILSGLVRSGLMGQNDPDIDDVLGKVKF